MPYGRSTPNKGQDALLPGDKEEPTEPKDDLSALQYRISPANSLQDFLLKRTGVTIIKRFQIWAEAGASDPFQQ